jgi:hypothetical protein
MARSPRAGRLAYAGQVNVTAAAANLPARSASPESLSSCRGMTNPPKTVSGHSASIILMTFGGPGLANLNPVLSTERDHDL